MITVNFMFTFMLEINTCILVLKEDFTCEEESENENSKANDCRPNKLYEALSINFASQAG